MWAWPTAQRLPPECSGRPVPWFVKTETFTPAFLALDRAERSAHLARHRAWVQALRDQSQEVASGFLVDGERRPGGGGLLLLRAPDHVAAAALIAQDPLIAGDWVHWQLHQWVPAVGDLAVSPAELGDSAGDDQRG